MSATHLVSVWSVENNFCLGQVKVAEKSNEITAIPILLELIDIKEATIQPTLWDANYVLGLKVIKAIFLKT
jgi:hypothetical protein